MLQLVSRRCHGARRIVFAYVVVHAIIVMQSNSVKCYVINKSGLYEVQSVVGAMAQLEDANQKGNWSPHDSLTHHLATHTPIQVPRQPDGATGAFHTMQHQGPWRLPFGGFAPTQPQSLFRPTWQQPAAEWQANNNKVNEWEKWNPTLAGELARPRPQLLSPQFGSQMIMGHAALSAVSPEQVVVEKCEEGKNGETPMDQDDLHSPKEDERKSAEHHSASYDASATPSLSGDDDERRLDVENADNNSEDHIDVEETTTPKAESEEPNTKDSTPILNALHYAGEDMKEDRNEKTMTAGKEEDAPHLLLNFIQHSLTSSSDQAHVSCATPSTEEKSTDNTVSFGHSGTSAFSNPESSQTSVISTTPVSSACESICLFSSAFL
uniref:BAT2_N domain-containing protein n=1 Tax=Heterorhabditis bacteriophora TaxID=37862 RepID=A0A1I7X6L0_HETBA